MNKLNTLNINELLSEEEHNLLLESYEYFLKSREMSIEKYYKIYFAEFALSGILCGAFLQASLDTEITVSDYKKLLNLFCDDYCLIAASLYENNSSAYGFINDNSQLCLDDEGKEPITEAYINDYVKKIIADKQLETSNGLYPIGSNAYVYIGYGSEAHV